CNALEAELLDRPSRGSVLDSNFGEHFDGPVREGEVQQGAHRLGGRTLAPTPGYDTIVDLDATIARLALEAAAAHDQIVGVSDDQTSAAPDLGLPFSDPPQRALGHKRRRQPARLGARRQL